MIVSVMVVPLHAPWYPPLRLLYVLLPLPPFTRQFTVVFAGVIGGCVDGTPDAADSVVLSCVG